VLLSRSRVKIFDVEAPEKLFGGFFRPNCYNAPPMPEVTIGRIVELVGGEFEGDPSSVIRQVRPLSEAGQGDLTFLANPKYEGAARESRASAILVSRNLEGSSDSWIRVDDPYYALARILQEWFRDEPTCEGVSELAFVSPKARLGVDVAIGPFAVVLDDAVIGDRVTIHSGTTVGKTAMIGDDTTIHANASIYHRTIIGQRCIIHSGSVIGSDGFGFATFDGIHHKIPQIGIVRIEDDVEIGAGTTIDRAALGETVIGEGTKIDNLVQIAHNVRVGRYCFIAAQVGIAGSTEIGDYCAFGGQSGVTGHVKLGARVMVAARAAVMKSISEPGTYAGSPARSLRELRRQEALLRRLPRFIERLERLEDDSKKDENQG